MRTINILLIVIGILTIRYEKNESDLIMDSLDGFCIKISDSTVLTHGDIDFYDFSTHLIYLKNSNSFLKNIDWGTFTVYVNGNKIYSGQKHPWRSSSLTVGPVIRQPTFYSDYIIPIGFSKVIDSSGNYNPDPRGDKRIIEALKENDQYHEGLKCEINSLLYLSSNSVTIELRLINNDSSNLYYLDPDRMGINLFHYFTNGLFLKDSNNKKTYTHSIQAIKTKVDRWNKDWLSIINSKKSKIISITYSNFETVTPGQYEVFFTFPGLSKVKKTDLQQDKGRIWLGKLPVTKEIMIE